MSVGISTALVIGGLAAAGGSIASSAIGAHAAGKAADQQAAAAQNAENIQQPWIDAGKTSLGKLVSGLNDGTFGPGSIAPFAAPTAAQAAQTPGYQFTKDQGQRAVMAQESANGGALGGGALKELDRYTTGLADSTYSNRFNEALQGYQAQLAGQSQAYNQLAGVAGTGQTAVTNVGNLMTQAGNAQAAGTVGEANAIGGGISGASNSILQTILLGKSGVFGGGATPPIFPTPGQLDSAGGLSVPPLDYGGLPPG